MNFYRTLMTMIIINQSHKFHVTKSRLLQIYIFFRKGYRR